MKRILLLFIGILLVTPQQIRAQKGEGVAAAIGAAAVIGSAIAAAEQIKEELELFATDYVLENYNFDAFELKIDGLGDKSKALDPSSVSILAFNITPLELNYKTPQPEKRIALIVFFDNGWRNDFGIDITKVSFYPFTQSTWNPLFFEYISLASGKKVTIDKDIPVYEDSFKVLNQDNIQAGNTTYSFTGTYKKVRYTQLSSKGVTSANKVILPFSRINGDTYLTSDFSNEFKVVFNERSLGLYVKSIGRLVQLKSSLVSDVTAFLNQI